VLRVAWCVVLHFREGSKWIDAVVIEFGEEVYSAVAI
jgi:hypothetical protein